MKAKVIGKIVVVNKYTHKGPFTYIGRGSVFGNPFPVSIGREQCIEKYREYMVEQLVSSDTYQFEMNKLAKRVLTGETVYLGCFCKPKACHGDVIKKCIDGAVAKHLSR